MLCAGCLIKGDTQHFEYICEAVTQGIMRLNLDTGTPVLFGVLTVNTMLQAEQRAGLAKSSDGQVHNHGEEWAESAITQALFKRECKPSGLLQAPPSPLQTVRDIVVIGACSLALFLGGRRILKGFAH